MVEAAAGMTREDDDGPWPRRGRTWNSRPSRQGSGCCRRLLAGLSSGQVRYLGELRPAVALFVGINGLDTEHDPDIATKLDAYVRWVQQSSPRSRARSSR